MSIPQLPQMPQTPQMCYVLHTTNGIASMLGTSIRESRQPEMVGPTKTPCFLQNTSINIMGGGGSCSLYREGSKLENASKTKRYTLVTSPRHPMFVAAWNSSGAPSTPGSRSCFTSPPTPSSSVNNRHIISLVHQQEQYSRIQEICATRKNGVGTRRWNDEQSGTLT